MSKCRFIQFLLSLLALIASSKSEEVQSTRQRRGFHEAYPVGSNQLNLGSSIELNGFDSAHLPLQETDYYSQGIDKFLPIADLNPVEIDLKVNLPPQKSHIAIPIAYSNSVEKPVEEPQEIVPPQSIGTAIIPQMPPPATPVNAAASNVPSQRGAVFLGSGSLGVVDLGNGAYALGSGSLGYSGNRAQPRPSGMVPVYPPLPASPNLIPAAVPSQAPPPVMFPQPSNIDFNHPLMNVRQLDRNGYEFLPPNRIAFGSPNPRPPRLRTTQSFATPTALQLQPQLPPPQQVTSGPLRFGQRIPNLYSFDTGF